MGVVPEPVEDAVGQRGIAYLLTKPEQPDLSLFYEAICPSEQSQPNLSFRKNGTVYLSLLGN